MFDSSDLKSTRYCIYANAPLHKLNVGSCYLPDHGVVFDNSGSPHSVLYLPIPYYIADIL